MTGMFDSRYDEGEIAAPQPLEIKASLGEATEYPLAALPAVLRGAIESIVAIAQVPVSLAAQSVLGAISLASQGFINVELITGQYVPVSLFLFTIAASGDRKSTSDKEATRAIKEREEQLATVYADALLRLEIEDAAYKAAVNKAKSGKTARSEIKEALEACGRPPQRPVQPLLTADEPTGPGLQRLFAEAMSSLGLFSDEGATFLGGWSMQEENQAATGGMLSKLWDGQAIKRIRADKENGTQILYGRRLCLHLMVQPDIAGKLLGNQAVRNQGLLSRILVAAPRSLKGSRFWREPTEEDRERLRDYHARLGRLLAIDFRYRDDTSRALDLDIVNLTPEARTRLIEFSDHCERQLGVGGKYAEIADFASKMTENATRLAANLAYFSGGVKLVREGLSLNAVNAGIALVEFYASEAMRLYGAAAVDEDTQRAAVLIDWIRKRELTSVGVRYLNRSGPTQTRNAAHLKAALAILEEFRHIVRIKGGAQVEHGGETRFYAEAYTIVPMDAA